MKLVSSITVWNDAVGKRMSITYSEIDETGKIISDSNRVDRVMTDSDAINKADAVLAYAKSYIDSI